MNRSRLSVLAGMSLGLLTSHAFAQSQTTKPKAPVNSATQSNKAVARAEADRIREGRRLQARSLLFSLSSDARGFRDQRLRARALARIADALWDVAADQSRTLFREAWDAAEKADKDGRDGPELRKEVLALIAKRDGSLAEEFLGKLKAEQEESKAEHAGDAAPSSNNLWELSGAAEKRLSLASSLLSAGDVKSALQYADPVLSDVTISTVDFLTYLREKDADAADRRYAAVLGSAGGNPLADANTVSILSSYIFTPHMYVIFNESGAASSVMMRVTYPPANVSAQMRLAFFRTAAAVLLRAQPPPEQDRSTTGLAGKYMALKRLMPLFERYAPPETAAAMRGQLEALNALVSDGVRQGESEWVQKGIEPARPSSEQERSLLDEVEHANTSDEKDQLYFKLALFSLDGDGAKARDYVSKIDESSFRKQARGWVDWSLAVKAIKEKKAEAALELAKDGELTDIQRVWVLTQSAKLLAKTDHDSALSLLDEAKSKARLIDRDDADRPRGLLAVAGALRQVEPARVWDAISDAVEAANWVEGFTGEDSLLTTTINARSQILIKKENASDFDVAGLFGEAARGDFDRAVILAGGFKGEAPRVNAVIAVARAVLSEKDGPVNPPRASARN
jgi:hypothetical protein